MNSFLGDHWKKIALVPVVSISDSIQNGRKS